mgnify:FL=1
MPNGAKALIDVSMHLHVGILMIVETGAAQARLVEIESQRLHKVQGCPGVGAKSYDIARIGRYLRLIEDNVEHLCFGPDTSAGGGL